MSVLARVLAAFRGVGVSPVIQEAARETESIRISSQPRNGHSGHGQAALNSALRAGRLNQIAAVYDDAAHPLQIRIAECRFIPETRRHAARDLLARIAGMSAQTAEAALRQAALSRPARDLNSRDRAILRMAEMLCELGEIDRDTELRLRLPVVWNKGDAECRATGLDRMAQHTALQGAIEMLLVDDDMEPADGVARLQRAWRSALSLDSALGVDDRRILENCQFITPSWLTAPAEPERAPSSSALKLGLFEGSHRDCIYDRAAGLITIAPAGARTRITLLLRNLLHLTAGAVVLDIDGRAFRETARWRHGRVGKVHAFTPATPAQSTRYNPLDAISANPTIAWADAQLLADLMIEPAGNDISDRQARDFLAPAILDTALHESGSRRVITSVLARLDFTGDALDAWIERLTRSFHAPLKQHAERLRTLSNQERGALLRRLTPQLDMWRSSAVTGLTGRADWTPDDLRRRRATLYICVNRADLARFAPMIRAIVGQTMAALGREKAVSPGATVTFFLDAVSRLGPIGIVEQMIHGGADVSVRPWLFFADDADMRSAYPDADAMIANCGAQCYIDPDAITAQQMSLRLGHCKSLFGAEQRALAEPDALMGPAFASRTVALVRGQPPARLVTLDAALAPGQQTRH